MVRFFVICQCLQGEYILQPIQFLSGNRSVPPGLLVHIYVSPGCSLITEQAAMCVMFPSSTTMTETVDRISELF